MIFLAANLLKVHEGGWMPLVVGGALMLVMITWRKGTTILTEKARKEDVPLSEFIGDAGEQLARAGEGHGGVPERQSRTTRPPRCCTTSSTTRCCTSRTSSCTW